MQHKKKWIIIGIVAVVLLLTAGITGGVVYAQSGGSSSDTTPTKLNPQKNLADRVAAILGLDATTVENAFTQAQKDIQDEALTNRLQALVQQGKLTQTEADQYKAWLEARPQLPQGLDLGPGLGPQVKIKPAPGNFFRGLPWKHVNPPVVTTPSPTTQ